MLIGCAPLQMKSETLFWICTLKKKLRRADGSGRNGCIFMRTLPRNAKNAKIRYAQTLSSFHFAQPKAGVPKVGLQSPDQSPELNPPFAFLLEVPIVASFVCIC